MGGLVQGEKEGQQLSSFMQVPSVLNQKDLFLVKTQGSN
jgi:hypothetical protein